MSDQWQDSIDPDGPSEHDLDRFGSEFKTCPECGSEAYDQAELCPSCGHAFDGADKLTNMPMWAMLVAGTLVVVFILWGIIF